MTKTYRAEHVGSLLRPPEVLEARTAHAQGGLSLERLREIEDEAALGQLALQQEAGIEVFTDGEVRRGIWMAGLMESLGGVVPIDVPTGLGWHRDGAADPDPEDVQFQLVAANGKLSRK